MKHIGLRSRLTVPKERLTEAMHHFIGGFSLKPGDFEITDKTLIHQIGVVLKLHVGEEVVLGDGRGNSGTGKILDISKKSIKVEIKEIINTARAGKNVTLYCALIKKDNFELVVQKAVEVGVSKIVPLITDRTIKIDINLARLEKIIKEACEQSGQSILPEIIAPAKLQNAFDLAKSNEVNLFFDMSGDKFRPIPDNGKKVGVFIGPEGGWTKVELDNAKKNGFKIVKLGQSVLRGETAAIIASFLSVNF